MTTANRNTRGNVLIKSDGLSNIQEDQLVARLSFRRAHTQDFDYCENLYFTAMERTIRELNLDMAKHAANFRQQLKLTEVRIITLDEADIGWLQTRTEAGALFLAQLFVDAPFQRRGIGSEVRSGSLVRQETRASA